MSGHTPGPWRIGDPVYRCTMPQHGDSHPGAPRCKYTFQGWQDHGDFFSCYVSSEPLKLVIVGSDEGGAILSQEDARLIAAAPEMLAFVQAFVATVGHHSPQLKSAFGSDMLDAARDARALLATINGAA